MGIRFQASYLGTCTVASSFEKWRAFSLFTVSALVGQVGEYVDGKEEYCKLYRTCRKILYFAANYVKKDNEVATLLAVVGADAYGVLRNLLGSQQPKDKSFDELKEVLIEHYSPKPILKAEQFKFHRHNQLGGESVEV